jgi:hypothetical protein
MKTHKSIRIVMMSMIALIVFSFASRAVAAIDAFLWFTDADGKVTKVKVNPDGTFKTPGLHAGTYKWSFGTTPSATATSKTASSAGSNPPQVYSIIVTPQLQPSGGATTGKRMHTPLAVIKTMDRSSPAAMTNLGTFIIDVNGDSLTGTVVAKSKTGGIVATDDWLAR